MDTARKPTQRGFTLVELIMVIVILGAIGGTVAVTTVAQSAALNAIGAKRVTVTVTGPQGAISPTGYRANY